MKVAIAQIACALGDVAANLAKMRDFCARAKASGAELIVFPEMSDTGYAMPAFGWPAAPIAQTLDRFGNCVAASLPLTLTRHS